MTRRWLLGIDGGGSTTRALKSVDGEVLEPIQGPGSNPFDYPEWRQTLRQLVARLPVASGPPKSNPAGEFGSLDEQGRR